MIETPTPSEAHIIISIPAYNDGDSVGRVIDESFDVLNKMTDRGRVYVIDDGSTDHTGRILQDKVKEYPTLEVYTHQENRGFGDTIREVYTKPLGEWVLFVPGDGQIPASSLLSLYPATDKYDFILGHRKTRQDPLRRRFTSWCYNWIVSFLAWRRIRDVNSAALIRKSILDGVEFKSQSAFIHAEILLKCLAKRARFVEIPIVHCPRKHGFGSGNRWSVIWGTVDDLLKHARLK